MQTQYFCKQYYLRFDAGSGKGTQIDIFRYIVILLVQHDRISSLSWVTTKEKVPSVRMQGQRRCAVYLQKSLHFLIFHSIVIDMFSRRTGLSQYKKSLTKAQTPARNSYTGLDRPVMAGKIFTASRLHGFTASRLHGFTASRLHGFTALFR